jgi:hypothetical protein
MLCCAQVSGTQALGGVPHWPATPAPPQVWPDGQEPHWIRFPHPSPVGPQAMLCWAHVVGVHDPESGAPH